MGILDNGIPLGILTGCVCGEVCDQDVWNGIHTDRLPVGILVGNNAATQSECIE